MLDRNELTAAHYLAYSYVLKALKERLAFSGEVLDFGAGRGVLADLLRSKGYSVTAWDRGTTDWTKSVLPLPFGDNNFGAVVATWAIQHNRPVERQTRIACELARIVWPGGLLVVVSSLATIETFEQHNRADPQIVLSWLDHLGRIIVPTGMQLLDQRFFFYEHGTSEGDWCGRPKANACCYTLKERPDAHP